MNLVIDFGNTLAKFYTFSNDEIKNEFILKYSQLFFIENKNDLKPKYFRVNELFLEQFFLEQKVSFENVIISSVINYPIRFVPFLANINKGVKIIELDYTTSIPLKNLYIDKESLGKDRIAAAVGANVIFPNTNVLVIDAGSAITFEYISDKNEYLGGNISPGLQMRFKALNTFTNKLPLIDFLKLEGEALNLDQNIGKSTQSAIFLGVSKGLLMEIEAYIKNMQSLFNNFKVILTGGDAFFFEKALKNHIFAQKNLVAIGLNSILKFNLIK